MENPLIISLIFGSLAALANIFGGLIIIRTNWHKGYLKYFLALGSGFMLAAAFLEMVPESFALYKQELWGIPIPALSILEDIFWSIFSNMVLPLISTLERKCIAKRC